MIVPGDGPPAGSRVRTGPHQQGDQRHDALLPGVDSGAAPRAGQDRLRPPAQVTVIPLLKQFILTSCYFIVSYKNILKTK